MNGNACLIYWKQYMEGGIALFEFGYRLRAARQQAGLSIKDAARKVEVPASYLEALEEGNLANLPGKESTLTILVRLSDILHLNRDEVIAQFTEMWEAPDTVKNYIQQRFQEESSKKAGFAVTRMLKYGVLFILAFVTAGGYYYWSNAAPPPEQECGGPAEQETAEPDRSNVELPGQPEAAGRENTPGKNAAPEQSPAVQLEIAVTRGDCWLEVVVDDELVLYETVQMGSELLKYEAAEAIRVVFGNAGAVEVRYNGIDLGVPGEMKEVVRKVFTGTGQ